MVGHAPPTVQCRLRRDMRCTQQRCGCCTGVVERGGARRDRGGGGGGSLHGTAVGKTDDEGADLETLKQKHCMGGQETGPC